MLRIRRAAGIKNHETVEVVATRDTFIVATAITIGLIFWVPRVAATWVMSAVSILGLVALILWPQYLGIIAAVVMNATAIAFFVAWHQSAKIAPVAESTTTTAMATTKRTRKQK